MDSTSQPRRRRWWMHPLRWFGTGLLSLLLMLLTFLLALVAFLAFENWRGHRAWERFTAECEAAGESLRPEAVIPPPVPDEDNFAAIPLFAAIWDYTINAEEDPHSAVWADLPPSVVWPDWEKLHRLTGIRDRLFPMPAQLNEWQQGKLFDAGTMQARFRPGSETRWPTGYHTAEGILAALSAVEEDLAQLRAAVNRPSCQGFDRVPDYPHASRVASRHFFDSVQDFAEIASLRSLANLSAGDSVAAAEDLLLVLKLIKHLRSNEGLGWPRTDRLHAMAVGVIWDGLARHAWSEGQLKHLDDELARIDRLSDCRRSIRYYRNDYRIWSLERLGRIRPLALIGGQGYVADFVRLEPDFPFNIGLPQGIRRLYEIPVVKSINQFIPLLDPRHRIVRVSEIEQLSATFDSMHTQGATGLQIESKWLLGLCSYIDPLLYLSGSKLCLQDRIRHAQHQLDHEIRLGYENLIPDLLEGYMPRILWTAQTQSTVDITRVAIALERHWLRQGQFPESLDALDPDVRPADGIPHDVINGEPLRYRRTDDGRFQLYSVGWNQTDDGGTRGWSEEERYDGTFERWPNPGKGDWVWPQPLLSP